jgi:cobalt transport protein
MKRVWWYLMAVSALAIILIAPLVMNQAGDMRGTDDTGADHTGADPWIENLFSPPEGSEPILFALIAVVGILVIIFILHRTRRSPHDGGKR